ncbi:hypothetical protein EWI61_14370 [Methylolobus aquaticus]|nr:hypothetical protein EWI61_14370 [Methylolobus aquaticus]
MSALCFAFGWASVGAIDASADDRASPVPLSVLPLIGLAEIAVLTAYLSLAMPIGLAANVIVAVVAIILLWICRHHLDCLRRSWAGGIASGRWELAVAALVFLVLLIKSAIVVDGTLTRVFHSDTAYYHAPSIRWISEYGVVPGLGNLLAPLAVDYLWFQPAALFGFSFLLPHRLHALMGFVVFWAFCFAFGGLRDWVGGGAGRTPSNLFRALVMLPLLELGNYIVSDSGDEPSAVFVLVTLALGCRYIERQRDVRGTRALFMAIAILALFSVGLKWSVLPLLLLAAAFTLQRAQAAGRGLLASVAALGVVMLAPKLIRSVILSGYLVYPFPGLDWFDVDWKMPREVVAIEKAYVESMARIRFDRPGELIAGGFSNWFADWVPRFFSAQVAQAWAFTISALLVVLLMRRRGALECVRNYWVAFTVVLLALVYWFVTAPHVRFAYGFLSATSILGLLAAGRGLPRLTPAAPAGLVKCEAGNQAGRCALVGGLGIMFAAALLFTTPRPFPGDALGSGVAVSDFYVNRIDRMRRGKVTRAALVYQTPYPSVETLLFPLGGLQIYRPATGQHCWDAPLPCTPYLYRRIEARGPGLAAGFRVVPGSLGDFDGSRLAREWEAQQAGGKASGR